MQTSFLSKKVTHPSSVCSGIPLWSLGKSSQTVFCPGGGGRSVIFSTWYRLSQPISQIIALLLFQAQNSLVEKSLLLQTLVTNKSAYQVCIFWDWTWEMTILSTCVTSSILETPRMWKPHLFWFYVIRTNYQKKVLIIAYKWLPIKWILHILRFGTKSSLFYP